MSLSCLLENLIDIGIAIPAFMIPLVKNIKSYTEAKVNITGSDEKEEK